MSLSELILRQVYIVDHNILQTLNVEMDLVYLFNIEGNL